MRPVKLNSTLQLTFKNRVTRSSHREHIHQGLGPFGVRRLLGLAVERRRRNSADCALASSLKIK
jgi:hypothetical protein